MKSSNLVIDISAFQINCLPDYSTYNLPLLLLKVSEADEQAFACLFKTYSNQLSDFILRLTESEQLTQEIVQDVFLKIWVNRRSLPAINCFNAYLFTIARNHAFNCLKQIAREKNRKREWVNSVLSLAVHNSEETIGSDSGKLIDEAIELLPPRQKNVYLMSRLEGIRQEEIAKQLNISLETVKKHMVLALRFLKNHLRTNSSFLLFFIASLFQE
jgi:RNA polymerase sigma-70 factor (family 1)